MVVSVHRDVHDAQAPHDAAKPGSTSPE